MTLSQGDGSSSNLIYRTDPAAPSVEGFRDGEMASALPGGPAIGWRSEGGRWQTRSQFVFDPDTRSLIRRTYTAWNAWHPQALDFAWTPDTIAEDAPGRVRGPGRLTWRIEGRPAYDQASIFAEYAGDMTDGKPNGTGAYFDRSGTSYTGEWSEGQFEGRGRLQRDNGDEYEGPFQGGLAHGEGRYFRADGEIYDGAFRNGLRDGVASVSLPSGLSYRSRWDAGRETAGAPGTQVAQLGASAPTADTVRIGISVDRKPIAKGMLGYAASNTPDGLKIRPADSRLMQIWKGSDNIRLSVDDVDPDRDGIFMFSLDRNGSDIWSDAAVPPILLALDIENRGSDPIHIVSAYLDVSDSADDLQPMVISPFEFCGPDYNPTFKLENFGWGPLEQTRVSYAFAHSGTPTALATEIWTKDLGLVSSTVSVSIEDHLRAAGVDVASLQKRAKAFHSFSCESKSQSECFAEALKSGLFGKLAPQLVHDDFSIRLHVVGKIEYKWTDGNGVAHDRNSPFDIPIALGTLINGAECEGGDIDALNTKKPLTLKTSPTGYRLPVDLQSAIGPGQVARYSLPVRAAKSSHYDFKIVLVLANGQELKARPIELTYFTPNPWGRKTVP